MIKEKFRGSSSARFIYYSYKDSPYYSLLLLSVILSFGILLFFGFVIPQFESFFSLRDEAIAARGRISILNSNLAFMSQLNKTALENSRMTVVQALPVEKDFASIISSINQSSRNAGVTIDDYTFGLGPLNSEAPAVQAQNNPGEFIYIKLSLKGNVSDIKNFIKEMSEKLPLNEVESIEAESDSAFITLKFFNKAYKAPKFNNEDPINPISSQNSLLINKLNTWRVLDAEVSPDVITESDPQKPIF